MRTTSKTFSRRTPCVCCASATCAAVCSKSQRIGSKWLSLARKWMCLVNEDRRRRVSYQPRQIDWRSLVVRVATGGGCRGPKGQAVIYGADAAPASDAASVDGGQTACEFCWQSLASAPNKHCRCGLVGDANKFMPRFHLLRARNVCFLETSRRFVHVWRRKNLTY